MNEDTEGGTPGPPLESQRRVTTVIYALQAAALLLPITLVVAVVVNYVKREDVADTWLASHFRWQIRTFWFLLLWLALGVVLSVILIGELVLFAAAVWFIYRVVKGWLRLSEGREMYLPV